MLGDVPEAVSSIHEVPLTSSEKKQFPCRVEGCGQLYTYLKARDNHKRKKQNTEISSPTLPEENTPSNRDHKKEHTLARLSFGFFILDMLDAVKEGDDEILTRLYKVALLFYKAYGHSNYAYSPFLLTLQVNASLSPRMAHSVNVEQVLEQQGREGEKHPPRSSP